MLGKYNICKDEKEYNDKTTGYWKDFVYCNDYFYISDSANSREGTHYRISKDSPEGTWPLLWNVSDDKILKREDVELIENKENVLIAEGIKYIGPCAFAECNDVKKIIIPEGVEEIGPASFLKCENLERIELPKSLKKVSPYAFYECKKLKKVTFKGKEIDIGRYAFEKCEELEIVNLPETVKKIGKEAFKNDINLLFASGAKSIDTIERCAFEGNIRMMIQLPERVRVIEYSAFKNCNQINMYDEKEKYGDKRLDELGITSYSYVRIPKNCEVLDQGVFQGCYNIIAVDAEDSKIKEIKLGTFSNCKNAKFFALPKGLEKIEKRAFDGCENMEEVCLPLKTEELESYAFTNCPKLKEVIALNSKTNFNEKAFENSPNAHIYTPQTIADKRNAAYLNTIYEKVDVEKYSVIGKKGRKKNIINKISDKGKITFNDIKESIGKNRTRS